ncbi:hypothetical protein MCHI_003215 [Candidatus Magnetoovum chiemensis]|nr:hypothetical protein MCHI_003215 [Candidatus Magnetoovum chiemensis]
MFIAMLNGELKKQSKEDVSMESKDVLFEKGKEHFVSGRYIESVGAFTSAIDTGYDTDAALLSRGTAFYQMKEFDRAIADFTCILEDSHHEFKALYYRGMSYLGKGEHANAIDDFTKAIEINSEDGRLFLARAVCYDHLGMHDEASKNYKTAMINSEAAIEDFANTFGVVRTQFDKSLAVMSGESKPYSISLTENEMETLNEWIGEIAR